MTPIFYYPKYKYWKLIVDEVFLGCYFKRADAVSRYNLYVEENPELGLERITTQMDVLVDQANTILHQQKLIRDLRSKNKKLREELGKKGN